MTIIPVDTSYIVDGQPIDASDVTIPLYDLKAAVEGMLNGLLDFATTLWQAPFGIAYTLASDSFTPTTTLAILSTQGGAASDDLSTIVHNATTPDMMLIRLANPPAEAITVKHNVGNIITQDGRDLLLSGSTSQVLVAFWDSVVSKWFIPSHDFVSMWLSNFVTSQIASDTASVVQTKTRLLGEGAASDSLSTINNPQGLDVLFLGLGSGAYTITLKHNVGNIWFDTGADVVLSTLNPLVTLVWDDVSSRWTGPGSTTLQALRYSDPVTTSASFNKLELALKSFDLAWVSATQPALMALPKPGLIRQWFVQAVRGTMAPGFLTPSFSVTGTPSANPQGLTDAIKYTGVVTNNTVCGLRSSGASGLGFTQARWSPTFEFVGVVGNLFNRSLVGLMTGTPSYNSGTQQMVWTGVYGFIIHGGTELVIYENGVQLAQSPFGSNKSNKLIRARFWVDWGAQQCRWIVGEIVSGGEENNIVAGSTPFAPVGTLSTSALNIAAQSLNIDFFSAQVNEITVAQIHCGSH